MPSHYELIRAENLREYGEGTRHLEFLGRLYTDRTHFIFELLQNAEDAAATKVQFDLFTDRLEVRHDGRVFNERDVRGVCGVGEGTKAEDLTQIGKFGIGFKSVYAYTSAPEIHSGDEHFRIEHYVRPYQAAEQQPGEEWTTLFIFAFDLPDLAADTARREIAQRLRKMSGRTLLFLRKIKEIVYRLPDETSGVYLREEYSDGVARKITVIGQNGDQEEYETWLVFEKPVPIPNSLDTVWIEIGFKLEESTSGERIARVSDAPLVAYFPTEKQTNFGFLIQGPYRTTPARDNVPKDDQWNTELIKETAGLTVSALFDLKAMGLLTVSLLEALPIRMEDFPSDGMFYLIVAAVHNALQEQELLPAFDETFVSASSAKLARGADLRELLAHDQLRLLFQTKGEIKWLSGDITADRTPDLRTFLLNELKVEEIDPVAFARKLGRSFLDKMDDKWFASFYEFLLKQEALWRAPEYPWDTSSILRTKPILRLEDGSLITPFDGDGHPQAYLPTEAGLNLPSVRRTITDHPLALKFLRRLGLTEPDAVARVVENILPKYPSQANQLTRKQYAEDLQTIFGALKTDSDKKKERLITEAQKRPFVKSINAATKIREYKKPGETYVPTPELSLFLEGNPNAWFVDRAIPEHYYKALTTLGSHDHIMLTCREPDRDGYVKIESRHSYHRRGKDGFDPNATIDGLEFALQNPNHARSCFIWNKVLILHVRFLEGVVETATRQDYINSTSQKKRSKFGEAVIEHAWVPTKDGDWRKPGELRLDELHPDLTVDDALIKAIGVKPSLEADEDEQEKTRAAHAHALGINEDDLKTLDLLKKYPNVFEKFKREIESQALTPHSNGKPAFPTRTSANPERREQRVAEQFTGAADKEYEQRLRSVRTTRSDIDPVIWLRSLYTNEDHQLICQICKDEMPFRKRDGEYYFEAVEALSRDHFSKEYDAQFLALCPLCSAMYQEFVKHDERAMTSFKQALINSEEPEIPIHLGVLTASIRFVDNHFGDLKTIVSPNGSSTAWEDDA